MRALRERERTMTYGEMVNAVMAAMKVGDRDAALAVVEAWQAANPGVPLSIPVVFVDEDGEPVEQVVYTPKPEEEPDEEPITASGIADELYGLASEIGEGVKYHGEFDVRALVRDGPRAGRPLRGPDRRLPRGAGRRRGRGRARIHPGGARAPARTACG